METGAKKPAAVAAPAPAAAARQPPQQQQQQQGEELFETKHAELLSEARDVAQEFGADVHAVVFRPGDGGAVRHEFVGAGQEARLKEVSAGVAKDVSAMGMGGGGRAREASAEAEGRGGERAARQGGG
ncbi:hypothetical protein HU200_050722 [Digitaria exilis]|uniref:Uncharacterized protein n=1 Tax=Digitaria exilis TaxID=1010633 RepID=A0A835AR90_9POAL|nr:hypothetical protein HU200_050722 [Digitaria exilis]